MRLRGLILHGTFSGAQQYNAPSLFYLFLGVGDTFDDTQGLLLAASEIALGGTRQSIWGSGNQIQLSRVQGKCLSLLYCYSYTHFVSMKMSVVRNESSGSMSTEENGQRKTSNRTLKLPCEIYYLHPIEIVSSHHILVPERYGI